MRKTGMHEKCFLEKIMSKAENGLKVMYMNGALEETLETHLKNVGMQFLNKHHI